MPGRVEVSSIDQQIAWEEAHIGNFRKIMPPPDPDRLNYYLKFYRQTNQVSIFQETAASKKREDLARKMRLQIEAKRAKQEQMLISNAKRKRPVPPRNVRERHRHYMYRLKENWTPGFVSDAEERLRNTWQQMRAEAIRNLKITESVSHNTMTDQIEYYHHRLILSKIYTLLFNLGHLSNTDITIFPSLYQHLQGGLDIKGAS